MYELILLITLPDEYAWTLWIVGIVFDNNGGADASYQLPCAEAVSGSFIIPVYPWADTRTSPAVTRLFTLARVLLIATHEIIPAHILIFHGETTNPMVGTMRRVVARGAPLLPHAKSNPRLIPT